MTADHLRQQDLVLSKCGRPMARDPRTRVVPIPVKLKAWAVFSAAPASLLSTLQTTIPGDTTFMFRAISSYVTVPVGLDIQAQLPDGRFLFHSLADIRSIAGWGSWRFPLTQERACPPGSKITLTFSDTAFGTAQAFPLLLEGSYFYHVKGGNGVGARTQDLASSLPRYRPGDLNQNIMAPSWMFGEGPQTPMGFQDDPGGFVRTSSSVTIDVGAATPKNGTALIQVEQGPDFPVRKLWFTGSQDATVTAADALVKIRDSSGYILTQDYIRYGILNGVPLPKEWLVKAGDTIIIDIELIDFAGTGNVNIVVQAQGGKRRAA